MAIYLLLIAPTLLCIPWGWRLSVGQVLLIWAATTPAIAMLMPIGSRDFSVYLENYADLAKTPFGDLPLADPLYARAAWIWEHMGGSAAGFYIAMSSLALLVTLLAFRKLTPFSAVAALLHMTSYFFLHEFTQLRAALAIAIWMHALAAIERSDRRYVLLTLFAATVHIQALLGLLALPLYRLTRNPRGRRFFVIAAVVTVGLAPFYIFDALGFAVISRVPDARAAIYLAGAEEGLFIRPNPFSIMSIIAFATGLFGLLHLPPFDARPADDVARAIFASLLIGSAALSAFSAITIGAFRISEHFFALLPVGIATLGHRFRSRALVVPGVAAVAVMQLYLFLIYSPYLLNPLTGVPNE